jgi:two-component system NtrC family sensor kinase
MRLPASLGITVPLILLGFAATLSTVNVLYHVPRAEQAAVDDVRKRLTQELSRLQSSLDYLLLKGNLEVAQREISVLAHNHDYLLVALTDERNVVIAATRRAWLGQPIEQVLPAFDSEQASAAIREGRAKLVVDPHGTAVIGYAGILLGSSREELRPSRIGSLYLAHDLMRAKSEARGKVLHQSLYWAGWVTALAGALVIVFHFLLTRRTARLVRAAEQLASGNLAARSTLGGRDEIGRLSRAFDVMAAEVADTQTRLREDIARRQRTEEALRVSEASYRAIFDAVEDAIFVLDVEKAGIVDMNEKAAAAFGYSRGEMRAIDLASVSSGEPSYTRQDARSLIARAIAGEQLHVEWHVRHKDGSLHWHEVFIKRVLIGGEPRMLALTRDVTQKKRAAEELARQREALHQREKLAALGSLLAGVAHELNNPLSVVVARAVMLEERAEPAIQHAAARIRTAAERCARIVQTFLAMARQQQPERGPVAINEVIRAALDITAYAVRTSGIEVALDLSEDIPVIHADADQLHQVFLNLVINALQALQECPVPRRLAIGSRFDASAHVVRIMVGDNGPGIPEALRARVFEPYFTTKPVGVGTGIGLAVSNGVIEAHGGRLGFDCPPEGGTIFTIELPAGAPPSAARSGSARADAHASRCAILVVDDEPEIREMLSEVLTRAQHRVVNASSGREALERMARETFDVILTDMRMPDTDGLAFFRAIEQRFPGQAQRVVFVTGDTLTPKLREFAARSGCPVIEKPFLPSEVRRIVAEVAMRGAA